MLSSDYFQFRLLRKTTDNEVKELVTGVLWNLSSCDVRPILLLLRNFKYRLNNTFKYSI